VTSSDWTWLFSSLAWSLVGFLLGYFAGRSARKAAHDQAPDKTWWRKFDFVIGTTVLLLSVLSVTISSFTLDKQSAQIGCQAQYNAAVSRAIVARQGAAADDRASLVQFVREVSVAKTPDAVRAAIDGFLSRAKTADLVRQRHPLPDPPTGNCE
jgi:hypothetical protein